MRLRWTAAPVATDVPARVPPGAGLTRRRLLATGGAAGAAAVVGLQPWTPAQAAAASDVPGYLLRSSYLNLSDPLFNVNGLVLKLDAVYDLPPTTNGPDLRGSEDAFSLSFSSPHTLAQGIYTFSNSELGVFDFFVAPVDRVAGGYEVLVNRSVNAPKHAPKPKQTSAGPVPQSAGSQPTATPAGAHKVHGAHVRRISARRLSRAVVAEVVLEPHVTVNKASVWLTRGDRIVSATSLRHIHGHRFAIRLPMSHRPRGGRYGLMIATTDRHGHVAYKRVLITLQ